MNNIVLLEDGIAEGLIVRPVPYVLPPSSHALTIVRSIKQAL